MFYYLGCFNKLKYNLFWLVLKYNLFTRYAHEYKKYFYGFYSHVIKINRKNINCDDKKVNKSNFYRNKRLFNIDKIDIDKILVSKKEPYGKKDSVKCFIGYNYYDYIEPLCIRLPQSMGYVKCFDNNKTTSFRIIDKKLLKKCTNIREKVSGLMNIEFDSEPIYGNNDTYIKTK